MSAVTGLLKTAAAHGSKAAGHVRETAVAIGESAAADFKALGVSGTFRAVFDHTRQIFKSVWGGLSHFVCHPIQSIQSLYKTMASFLAGFLKRKPPIAEAPVDQFFATATHSPAGTGGGFAQSVVKKAANAGESQIASTTNVLAIHELESILGNAASPATLTSTVAIKPPRTGFVSNNLRQQLTTDFPPTPGRHGPPKGPNRKHARRNHNHTVNDRVRDANRHRVR